MYASKIKHFRKSTSAKRQTVLQWKVRPVKQLVFVSLTVGSISCEGEVMQVTLPLCSLQCSRRPRFYSLFSWQPPDFISFMLLWEVMENKNERLPPRLHTHLTSLRQDLFFFMFSSFTSSSTISSSCHFPSSLKAPHVSLLPLHICDDSSSTALNRRPEVKPSGRMKTTRQKTRGCLLLVSFRRRDNQVLVESRGKIKGRLCGGGERWCFSSQRSFGCLWKHSGRAPSDLSFRWEAFIRLCRTQEPTQDRRPKLDEGLVFVCV